MFGSSHKTGALPSQMILSLVEGGFINGADKKNIRPSSLDLTISDEVYRVERLFLPREGETIRALLPAIGSEKHDLSSPMEKGVTYLIRLNETLALPDGVYALCNPKSTTGRNDILTRVLADGIPRYDEITPAGWKGELWVAVSPKSYPIKVHAGHSFNQARLFSGDTHLDGLELKVSLQKDGLIYDFHDKQLTYDDLTTRAHDGLVTLTLDLSDDIPGYCCSEPSRIVDLSKVGGYSAKDFFEPIRKKGDSVSLEEGKFYIISTAEKVRVPPEFACEMKSMDERYGEFRAHYAGFIDPGWGWGKAGEGTGRPLTLEVRPFENLEVRQGQAIARIGFERMAAVPEMIYDTLESNYIGQSGPKLAKQFI